MGFPGGSNDKASACNAEDLDSIPESGRSPGKGNDYPLQDSCLEDPMNIGAWRGCKELDITEQPPAIVY